MIEKPRESEECSDRKIADLMSVSTRLRQTGLEDVLDFKEVVCVSLFVIDPVNAGCLRWEMDRFGFGCVEVGAYKRIESR